MHEPFASEMPVSTVVVLPAAVVVGTTAMVVGTVSLSGLLAAAGVLGRSYRLVARLTHR